MRHGSVFGSVCMSVYYDLNFECLGLEPSFLVCRYIFRIFRSNVYIKVSGSRSRSQEQKSVFVGGPCVRLKGNLVDHVHHHS